jgi:hypothetical protein
MKVSLCFGEGSLFLFTGSVSFLRKNGVKIIGSVSFLRKNEEKIIGNASFLSKNGVKIIGSVSFLCKNRVKIIGNVSFLRKNEEKIIIKRTLLPDLQYRLQARITSSFYFLLLNFVGVANEKKPPA